MIGQSKSGPADSNPKSKIEVIPPNVLAREDRVIK